MITVDELDQRFVVLTTCPICNSRAVRPLETRSDGVGILQCEQCKMGFVERYPKNLRAYYTDAYYMGEASAASEPGYQDYDTTAAHSLGWVAYFIRLWRSAGRVLDIGCVNGYLLHQIGAGFEPYGIEVNSRMVELCRSRGITIIGQDIQDVQLVANYAGRFDVITGIAILEHVPDLRGTLQQIKALLAPGGVFIFEVPLISETQDNSIWYKSSLEHIYYPTVAGLHYVIEDVFGAPPIGSEMLIQKYASTFVGMIASDRHAHERLAQLYERIFKAPFEQLHSQEERTCRFLIDVIHMADATNGALALLPSIDRAALTPGVLERIATLWQDDDRIRQLENARDYFMQQAQSWEAEAAQLTEARDFYARQAQSWEAEAAAYKPHIQGLETTLNNTTEAADYHAQQAQNWQSLAEERAAWAAQLEEARDYHAQQVQNWQAVAESRDQEIKQLQQQLERRLLHRIQRAGLRLRRRIV